MEFLLPFNSSGSENQSRNAAANVGTRSKKDKFD